MITDLLLGLTSMKMVPIHKFINSYFLQRLQNLLVNNCPKAIIIHLLIHIESVLLSCKIKIIQIFQCCSLAIGYYVQIEIEFIENLFFSYNIEIVCNLKSRYNRLFKRFKL